ncbi:hypothetical protein F1559_002490 [Cyanidiococcus yangmingshanensis]|uniref:Copper transport protein n=1 Tax=Cyanidiococcus yangmingshanensis TaxID=2690220 RepID=A0A7J7IJJ3_9RHOD|nr:hypothetical protein F1559_002490 [Cyanidiococcus yangmingshanensis]
MTTESSGLPALMKAHGSFGYVSGALFMLCGVFVARYTRFWRYWFIAHVALELFGFFLTVIAFILTEIWHQGFLTMQDLHAWNGFAFLCLYYVQLWIGWLRPEASSRFRRGWRWVHFGVGVLLVGDFVIQAYSGIHRLFRMFNVPNGRYFVVWTVALGLIAVSISFLEPTKWLYTRVFLGPWRDSIRRYMYRRRVLLVTIGGLGVLSILFLVFLSTIQSTNPWSNGDGMSNMPMSMHSTFFWYDPAGFNLWFSNFMVIGIGRLIAAGLVVGILAFTASFVLHALVHGRQQEGQPRTKHCVQLGLALTRAMTHSLLVALHYLLMLAVMTYSVPLLLFILCGHGLGALVSISGRAKEPEETLAAATFREGPESPKAVEDSSDLRVLLNADCCTGSGCCGSNCTCKPGACFCGIEVQDKSDGCCSGPH